MMDTGLTKEALTPKTADEARLSACDQAIHVKISKMGRDKFTKYDPAGERQTIVAENGMQVDILSGEILNRATINASGLVPVEFRVLVKPDDLGEKDEHGTKIGSLYIPDTAKERQELAQARGTLIQAGGRAFEDFGDPRPRNGDRVWFIKFGGVPIKGADGLMYRLISDKDVGCIVMDERAEVVKD